MDLICANEQFFKNPDKLPLNELYFDYRKVTRLNKVDRSLDETVEMLKSATSCNDYYKTEIIKRPALDKCWIDRKTYDSYHRYDLSLTEDQNEAFFKNRMFLKSVQFLNECTYHQFWCYIYYESRIIQAIKEYLHNALPLCLITHLSNAFLNLHKEIHSCIRNIYQRILQFKVSEHEYVREDVARSMIQEKGLLNTNMILMLCYLYNSEDSQFISNVMKFCLKRQDAFLRSVHDLLKSIADELVHFTKTWFPNQNTTSVEEKIFFLFEIGSILYQFFSSCKPAIDVAFYVELPYCISYVYQNVHSENNDFVSRGINEHNKDLIEKWLAYGKFEFVNLFHVFATYCLDAILNLRENSSKQYEYVHLYIGLISDALENDLFIVTYDKTYPIREQFETLMNCVSNFDVQQSEYLLKSINTMISEFSNEPEPEMSTPPTPPITSTPTFNKKKYNFVYETLTQYLDRPSGKKSNLPKNVSLALEQYYELTNEFGGRDETKPSSEKVESSVRAVLDVLPHLERDFVLTCLTEMNYDVNEVITKILSQDLSNSFNSPSPSTSRVEKYSNANEMLDDKKEKENMKQFILKAAYTIDLDDEYDDRIEINNTLSDSDDESRIYRHLEGENEHRDDDESSSSEEAPPESRRDTKSDFCVDPALVREIRSQQYQNSRRIPANKNSDKGGDKSKYVTSTRPKHNRKGGAHWKRNKGMIPS